MFYSKFHTKEPPPIKLTDGGSLLLSAIYFWQQGGSLDLSPVFDCPLDEQLPEQPPQQPAVPLNRPRT